MTIVREIKDKDLLHSFYSKDRVAYAYQLGDLDEAYFPWCKWWGAFDSETDELETAILLYSGLSVPVTLIAGKGEPLDDLLTEVYSDLPDRFFCQVGEDHLEVLSKHYDTNALTARLRMANGASGFERAPRDPHVVRLGHSDTARIVELYTHYPDNFFEPYQLETGLYFGIHDGSGGPLVSIAGIHVLSEEFDVAVVGNLVTHDAHRGKQLARRVTGRLMNELFERVSLVALNVAEDNLPAIKIYEHFRFEPHLRFFDGMVKRSLMPK